MAINIIKKIKTNGTYHGYIKGVGYVYGLCGKQYIIGKDGFTTL